MWGLLALTAAIFLRSQSLRFCEPSQARPERGLGIPIPFHLQTNIQHRINSRGDVPTPLALHFTLQLTQKGRVYDTVTRDVRRPTRGGVDLIQCRNEKFVGVLLCVSSQFRGSSPRGGQKRDWTIGPRFPRVYLREELVQLATSTVCILARSAVVFVAQEVIAEERVVDEALEDDVQETRLTKVEKSAAALALNRFSIFECSIILFVWPPGVVGFTALLRNCRISVTLQIRG